MDKNLPASAGDLGLIPGPRISHVPKSDQLHVPQLLSLRAVTTEGLVPRACALQQGRPPQ